MKATRFRASSRLPALAALPLVIAFLAGTAQAVESTCYGTVSRGALKDGIKLPVSGVNFSAYSTLGTMAGRTYVHSKVAETVVAAYAALEKTAPSKIFVYGETGWASGGPLRPHKTHQNGTSVDFFVPVLDAKGHSVNLPTTVFNKLGYNIEFDSQARFDKLTVDFEAIGEHLFQLQVAAAARKLPVTLVIFDPRFMPRLFQTAHGPHLQKTLRFMQQDAWVRHDEHYHVDFGITCKPKT